MAETPRLEIPAGPQTQSPRLFRALYHEVIVLAKADVRKQAAGSGRVGNLFIVADKENAGDVYWGDSKVTKGGGTKPGFPLGPGDSTGPWDLAQVSQIHGIGGNAGDIIVLMGLQG